MIIIWCSSTVLTLSTIHPDIIRPPRATASGQFYLTTRQDDDKTSVPKCQRWGIDATN